MRICRLMPHMYKETVIVYIGIAVNKVYRQIRAGAPPRKMGHCLQ